MPFRVDIVLLALGLMVLLPVAASGQGAGGPGCTNLPEYNRALGALQGMTSACDMTIAQACRILAAHGTPAAGCPQPAPEPRRPRRPHRTEAPSP